MDPSFKTQDEKDCGEVRIWSVTLLGSRIGRVRRNGAREKNGGRFHSENPV